LTFFTDSQLKMTTVSNEFYQHPVEFHHHLSISVSFAQHAEIIHKTIVIINHLAIGSLSLQKNKFHKIYKFQRLLKWANK